MSCGSPLILRVTNEVGRLEVIDSDRQVVRLGYRSQFYGSCSLRVRLSMVGSRLEFKESSLEIVSASPTRSMESLVPSSLRLLNLMLVRFAGELSDALHLNRPGSTGPGAPGEPFHRTSGLASSSVTGRLLLFLGLKPGAVRDKGNWLTR